MKTLLITLVNLFLFGATVFAQSDKYQKAMEKNVALFDTARAMPTMLALESAFGRIAAVEKTQWLPYYYAAMCATNAANREADKNQVDAWADKAEALAAQADSLSPNNSEISCLKAIIHFARINVDFMARGPKYSALGAQALQQALTQNPNNPRAMMVLAQLRSSAPAGYGGDKAQACQLANQAVQVFAQTTTTGIEPHWGRQSATKLTKTCEPTAQK